MKYAPVELLTVYLGRAGGRKVGRLALRQRRILFEYDPAFVATGIELSPLKLPLQSGVFTPSDAVFDGLYGLFNDSLPDGWGRLLLDRTVEKQGIRHERLTALDRLACVGRSGMGALSYEPDRSPDEKDETLVGLDRVAEEAAIMLAGESEEVFEELLRLNGSSAGARPKIVAQVSPDRKRIIHGPQSLKPGFEHWMIKFQSLQDPRDIGAIEYAYSLMARRAGIDVPEAHLFRTRKRGYFGTKRFDRIGDLRVHVHSLSGVIHADHRNPSLDYDMLLRVTLALTRSVPEAEKAYALACFNVLSHNRDDHAKNFAFLLNDENQWRFAPAYDLTFSNGPAGEQTMMVMGEGKNPGPEQLIALAKAHNLKRGPRILERVRQAISRWRNFAGEAGVSAKSACDIDTVLNPTRHAASRIRRK
ncbi:MAG TPA: type II toxin-antitoxin system HipA family toxin [Verrucomicrobiae bacterium]|nr:type II toxin-antitoxin system HipA family toxin [Verrucomicrobiae bacterium]